MSITPTSKDAFQDLLPDLCCYGCGPNNDHGLRIKSYWKTPGISVCTFQPQAFHCAGPPSVVNGGIIATLIDCHCVCTAMAAAYEREGRDVGVGEDIGYVTASLTVRYLRPTPLGPPVRLEAQIRSSTERKTVLACTVTADGMPRAEGEVVAVRVTPSWTDATVV